MMPHLLIESLVTQWPINRHDLVLDLKDLGAWLTPTAALSSPSCRLAVLLYWNLPPCPSCRGIYLVLWHRSLCVKEDAASYPSTQWAGP